MSPEAQRIAIAKACGHDVSEGTIQTARTSPYRTDDIFEHLGIPDFLNDLNAMAEAERFAGEHLMDADQWENYGRLLERAHPSAMLRASNGEIDYYDFATLMTGVTAARRAEAFLKAKGLWVE